MVGIGLPGVAEYAQGLLDLQQIELHLLCECGRLARDIGCHAAFGLGALGAGGAYGADPGQPDQCERGQADGQQSRDLADTLPLHRVTTYGHSRSCCSHASAA